ncbi:hypothetical protein BVRB_8g187820 [Beta vulgaris subsp. vulgaris]|nr:hypothetical protein BVRB_8g187820 [Beta vulgaris subsp. vulgaris]
MQIIKEPVETEGALEAFVSIVTGPLGPSPVREADARDFSINFGFVGRSRSVYPT